MRNHTLTVCTRPDSRNLARRRVERSLTESGATPQWLHRCSAQRGANAMCIPARGSPPLPPRGDSLSQVVSRSRSEVAALATCNLINPVRLHARAVPGGATRPHSFAEIGSGISRKPLPSAFSWNAPAIANCSTVARSRSHRNRRTSSIYELCQRHRRPGASRRAEPAANTSRAVADGTWCPRIDCRALRPDARQARLFSITSPARHVALRRRLRVRRMTS